MFNSSALGIFGGTFDPIHLGHTQPLEAAATLLGLSTIRLMPAHIPPHKQGTVASSEQRLAMVKLICDKKPLFTLDSRELKRHEKSYTVTTLQEIKTEFPDNKLYFFIGMDSLINFTQWYQWQTILTLCQLVVMPRPGYQVADIPETLLPYCQKFAAQDTNSYKAKIILLPACLVDISSSEIRGKIAQQKNISTYLDPDVEHYIKKNQLYQATY